MGKTNSRRGGSAAPAAKPSHKRRPGKHRRAATPANPAAHTKPPRSIRLGLRSVQVEPATPVRPRESGDPGPKNRIPASAGINGESFNVGGSSSSPGRARPPGPSLRQDIPRPPLRHLLLRTRRRGALVWRRGRERWQARAARTAGQAIARLDAWVWQPAMWPFRPAQRELLARTLAALAVAIVALAWIVAYSILAPTPAVRAPAPLPPPPKQITGRVVPLAPAPAISTLFATGAPR